MKEVFHELVALEAVSAEIDRLDGLLAEFPAEEEVIAAGLRDAEAKLTAARAALEHEELEERRLESAMKDQEALILKLNHQSADVASNEAYTALQNELDAAEAAKTEFETHALEHMEAIDAAKEVVAEAEKALARVEGEAPGQRDDIAQRRSGVESEKVVALEKRAAIADRIEARVLKQFDTIRARRRPAIAVLEGKSCPQCKIMLPRLLVTEILALDKIHTCSSCKRLLAPAKAFE